MKTIACLFLAAVSLHAEESMARFGATCFAVCAKSERDPSPTVLYGACVSEDAPGPDFQNRFRISIRRSSPIQVEMPKIADWIRVQATPAGTMVVSSILWGAIQVVPSSAEIRQRLREAAPAFEVLPQYLSLSHDGEWLTLVIEQPHETMDTWLQAHERSRVRLMQR